MGQEHVSESIPAYVLGCLDENEYQSVNRHILECPKCQEEARNFQKVVDALPLAARDCAPPPELRQKIITRVSGVSATVEKYQKNLPWYRRIFGQAQPVLLFAAFVLIVVLGVANITQYRQLQQLKQEKIAGAFQYVNMVGTQATPKAAGLLIISADQRTATLIVDGLPPLPERQEYQLWLIQEGKRTSGGVFNVIETGFGALLVNSPQPIRQFQAFGITIEPKGGSPGPTGDKVLGGNF